MGKPIKVKRAKRLRNKELIPFTRQLASMLGAGMTILASIQTLGEQSSDLEFKKVLKHLGDVIEGGAPMSAGLADFPQLFDDMYVNMVIAGEQSGEFAGIMKRLANILQSSSRLKRNTRPMTPPPMTYHHDFTNSEMSTSFCVSQGSSLPKPLNISANTGTTNWIRPAASSIAMLTMTIG